MSYKLTIPVDEVWGMCKFVNAKDMAECVEFVRQATMAPNTKEWKKGVRVEEAKAGEIAYGTAIATFDDKGCYPTDKFGMHAALYVCHDKDKIVVLDQYKGQDEVKTRFIKFPSKGQLVPNRAHNAATYYVIEKR